MAFASPVSQTSTPPGANACAVTAWAVSIAFRAFIDDQADRHHRDRAEHGPRQHLRCDDLHMSWFVQASARGHHGRGIFLQQEPAQSAARQSDEAVPPKAEPVLMGGGGGNM